MSNKEPVILDLLEDQENKLDEKKLEELTKALYELDEKQHKKDAFDLAVTAGDHFNKKESYSTAETFYKLAFKWDNTSEEIYTKLFKILGKQGKYAMSS